MRKQDKQKWYMGGTEGTGEYLVIARALYRGRIGVRLLSCGNVRIRVEPVNTAAAERLSEHFPVGEWKQPDLGQLRFSRVLNASEAIPVIEAAIAALDTRGLESNSKARTWRSKLRKHAGG